MSLIQKIQHFEKKTAFAVGALALCRALMRTAGLLLLGFLLFSGIESVLTLPGTTQRLLWSGLVLAALALGGAAFFPLKNFSLRSRSRNLSARSSTGLREDDFLNAVEFSLEKEQPGTSPELKNVFLEQTAERLSRAHPFQSAPAWAWRPTVLFFLSALLFSGTLWAFLPDVFPLNARLFYPFGVNKVDSLVHVLPGNGTVPWGGKVEIQARLRVPSIEKPQLFVKRPQGWSAVDADEVSSAGSLYFFNNVVSPLVYRFQWKNEWTSSFEITPLSPLTVEEFKVDITNPGYTGGETVRQDSPELSGLAGSLVKLEAVFSENVQSARILFSNETEKKTAALSGRRALFEFPILFEGTYQFAVSLPEGPEQILPEVYPVHLIPDEAPVIRLLSPEEDLISGDKEVIPLTFDAVDDFGVSRLVLEWEKGGKKDRKTVETFDPPVDAHLGTYSWNLQREAFQPGDVVRFRLEAVDGNKVTGPGRHTTDWRIIEIASFEASHQAIEEALEKWREETLTLLADLTTKQAELEKAEGIPEGFKEQFSQTGRNSDNLQKFLEKIVEQMEKDPLSDYGVWLEHQAMSDSFEALNRDTMKNIQSSLQTGNSSAAQNDLKKAASEIERMLALSEDLSKTQRARDVMESSASLEKLGENLQDLLSSAEKMAESQGVPPDVQKEIDQLLSEAMSILSDMARTFEDFPNELPEDFINQEALKDMDMDGSKDILSQIQDALKKGDFAAAAEMAKQFLDATKKMRDSLSEAHESFVDSHSPAQLEKEIKEQSEELSRIAGEQRDILSKTSELEKKRLESLLQDQAKRLEELFQKQKELNEKISDLLEGPSVEAAFLSSVRGAEGWMEAVSLEFQNKKVDQAPSLLTQIIAALDRSAEGHSASAAHPLTEGVLKNIAAGEREILDILRGNQAGQSGFSSQDKADFDKLEARQKALQGQTEQMRGKLEGLSQRTASLGVPLNLSLLGAEAAMNEASGRLGGRDSHQALSSEGEALEKLMDAQSQMSQAQDAFQQMGQASGQPGGGSGGGGPRILLREGARGQQGSRTGRVTLPRAEDYKAPKDFRKELLESLKEKYPKVYEEVIHKYFKRLAD